MNQEQIARVAHEANRAYCQTLGDDSQPSWMDTPDWQVKSAINGVQHIIDNPEAKPEDSPAESKEDDKDKEEVAEPADAEKPDVSAEYSAKDEDSDDDAEEDADDNSEAKKELTEKKLGSR